MPWPRPGSAAGAHPKEVQSGDDAAPSWGTRQTADSRDIVLPKPPSLKSARKRRRAPSAPAMPSSGEALSEFCHAESKTAGVGRVHSSCAGTWQVMTADSRGMGHPSNAPAHHAAEQSGSTSVLPVEATAYR